MFVVFCVGSGLCDGLITRSKEFCRFRVCVCVCFYIYEPQQWGGVGPNLAIEPQKENDTFKFQWKFASLIAYLCTYPTFRTYEFGSRRRQMQYT